MQQSKSIFAPNKTPNFEFSNAYDSVIQFQTYTEYVLNNAVVLNSGTIHNFRFLSFPDNRKGHF